MPPSDRICTDLRELVLQLAGEAGQASLAASGDTAGLRAAVDQHAAEIRDSLTRPGRPLAPETLLSYAQGFTEAAVGRGWWPPHRREYLSPEDQGLSPWLAPDEPEMDWESIRLAAICRLLLGSEGLPA